MISGSHETAAWAASSDVAAVVETEFVVISHVSKKLANQRHQRGRELTLGHESIRFKAPTATPAGARRRRAPTMTTPLNFAADPEARVMSMLKLFEWCGGASVAADPSWQWTRGRRQNFQIIGTQKTAMTKNHSMQTMPSFQ
jgi:hypothetical protein